MELIQCHTWTRGYHTLSCPIVPFNLVLLSSQLWTCFSISESSFPFLTTMLRKWFKVNVVHLVVKGHMALSYGTTLLFYLMLFHLYYGKHRHNVQDALSKVTPPSPDNTEMLQEAEKMQNAGWSECPLLSALDQHTQIVICFFGVKRCKVCFENETHWCPANLRPLHYATSHHLWIIMIALCTHQRSFETLRLS